MGGAVSCAVNNDGLVDLLIEGDYIKTQTIERVFRAVDRGDYITTSKKAYAYRDVAWKQGNVHLSAPCIYSTVMENLQLEPGMSFLNLGSGSGYLSTMAGLLLGSGGVNHGVEIYEDVVEYAELKLGTFKACSRAMDEYEFCDPKFVVGNCLCLEPTSMKYDRVYCGAVCPERHLNYIKNLMKVGGILVIPVIDHLFKVVRTEEDKWDMLPVLPVSFSSLILPAKNTFAITKLPDVCPPSLQERCKVVIRKILKTVIDVENPHLINLVRRKVKPNSKNEPSLCTNNDKPNGITLSGTSNMDRDYISRLPRNKLYPINEDSDDDDDDDDLPQSKRYKSLSLVTLWDPYFQMCFNSSPTSSSVDNNSSANKQSENNSNKSNEIRKPSGNQSDLDKGEQDIVRPGEIDSGYIDLNLISDMRSLHSKIRRVLSEITDLDNSDDDAGETSNNEESKDGSRSPPYSPITDSDSFIEDEETILECETDIDSDITFEECDRDEDVVESYSNYMVDKIQFLPLPSPLKVYLNNNRSL